MVTEFADKILPRLKLYSWCDIKENTLPEKETKFAWSYLDLIDIIILKKHNFDVCVTLLQVILDFIYFILSLCIYLVGKFVSVLLHE